jgi:hypothetical protein
VRNSKNQEGRQSPAGVIRVEWEPDFPKKLTKNELRTYQAGRNALYQRAANIIGGTVLLAE